jgi:hypothetical protein
MDIERFEYLTRKQSEWATEYKLEQALKKKERLIRMRKYKSRGNKTEEEIQMELNNQHH